MFPWAATDGSWNSAGVDWRAFLSAKTVAAGTGIIPSEAGPQIQVAVDSAAVPTYIRGSATRAFPSVSSAGCASQLTFALPGAAVGDSIAEGWLAVLPDGPVGTMRVSLATTIPVRLATFPEGIDSTCRHGWGDGPEELLMRTMAFDYGLDGPTIRSRSR